MTTLTTLARAEAVVEGRAQRTTLVRHMHVAERPLVFIPLTMAGEANAPLAAMVGDDPDAPTLLIVPQPRNRDQRFAFAAELAAVVLPYIDSFRGELEAVSVNRGKDIRIRYADAPQLLLPNPAGAGFTRLFGRSTRFRRTDGDYPVHPSVPLLGRWLTYFAERAEHPGSCSLVAMTQALTLHWATGQSPLEDAQLAALLAWIAPPDGLTGAQAAAAAEDPVTWPPAGPTTDPSFDNEVLAPAMTAYQRAVSTDSLVDRRRAELEDLLRSQLEPTWRLMWQGVSLLRELPVGSRVAGRWAEDCDAFTNFTEYVDGGGFPQARRDGAVAAAKRLHRLERAQASYDVQRAYDDPMVMADYRLTGEAFVGEVTAADPTRVDSSGKKRVLRPWITVTTADPVLVTPGTKLFSPDRPGNQKATVVSTARKDDGSAEVVLELAGGMGSSLTPPPGSVPGVGEQLCYTTLTDTFFPAGAFPSREETPWTHGGPPAPYEDSPPTAEDAREEWS
ncbi:hypothetical protein [Micromonospora cremea]|uniref:Uncharacterized protein n=1 Tax=Micromonospora cremea TaxID=709881 RepID=A0A1N6ANV3_9ACTN|nr:hypothetical protein [Micromonospora cremea]SIN35696.1 hypothetical protein SAMN04489832_5849 [Micromonospora cremea]